MNTPKLFGPAGQLANLFARTLPECAEPVKLLFQGAPGIGKTAVENATEEGRTILGLIQQHGEPDYAAAEAAAQRKHGPAARLYSEGDDLDASDEANAGTQWLVVSAK